GPGLTAHDEVAGLEIIGEGTGHRAGDGKERREGGGEEEFHGCHWRRCQPASQVCDAGQFPHGMRGWVCKKRATLEFLRKSASSRDLRLARTAGVDAGDTVEKRNGSVPAFACMT